MPLLLIDFHSERARRLEVARRAAADVATSVLGWTVWGNLSYFAAKSSYEFYQDRRGAALNRSMRLAGYARVRQMLMETGGAMDPEFHRLIESRLDQIALNPFEQGSAEEAALARRQYEALQRWVEDPEGLAKSLAKDRAREYYVETHSAGQRAWREVVHVAAAGVWKKYKVPGGAAQERMLEALDRERRLDADAAEPAAARTASTMGQ